MRTSSVLTTTTPRLFGHRQPRPIACFRRGTMNSQTAMAMNTPPNALDGSRAHRQQRSRMASCSSN